MSIQEDVEAVETRDDLTRLINKLAADAQEHPDDWENLPVRDYLEALAAWLEDMDGYFANIGQSTPGSPTWKLLGQALLAAKCYE